MRVPFIKCGLCSRKVVPTKGTYVCRWCKGVRQVAEDGVTWRQEKENAQ